MPRGLNYILSHEGVSPIGCQSNIKDINYNMAKEALTRDGKSFYWYDKVFFVELLIPYDANASNDKDLRVEFKNQHLLVGVKGEEPIIDGDLYEDVEDKGFTWSLKNNNVHVVIKKSEAFSFWQHLFKNTEQKVEGH